MSNVISFDEKLVDKVADKTYTFLNKKTKLFNIDNNVYYNEHYIFCKTLYDYMIKNKIDNNLDQVMTFVINHTSSYIIANEEIVNIQNIVKYSSLFLNMMFYRLSFNPIKILKINLFKVKAKQKTLKFQKSNNKKR
ncbi:MAG TPA: hypothetical protein GXZ95_01810 [Mollicutes bacterium]|nr:hypothetical protein [Mollicutes bacterium]